MINVKSFFFFFGKIQLDKYDQVIRVIILVEEE